MTNPITYLSHEFMIPAVSYLYGVTHSYGWSIVLLTVIIKAFLFPLTAKQFISMRRMQKLQPQLQAMQKEFKNNPEELQKRMMGFYKENNLNPMAGCLPMLVQIPILWSLYEAFLDKGFLKATEGVHFLFIQNLAEIGVWDKVHHILHWDSLLLLLIMGASTYLTQKMMTTNPDDPMQKQMLIMMPISLTVMFAFIPVAAGVLLYWAISNLISILQNWFLLRRVNAAPVVAGPSITTMPEPKDEVPAKDKKAR